MISDEVAKYLEGVEGTVEATNYEKHALWTQYSQQSRDAGFAPRTTTHGLDWQSGGFGFLPRIGYIKGLSDLPVTMSLLIDTVAGHRLLFWYLSGTYADHDLAEKWLTENVPAHSLYRADANNFHNVLHELDRVKIIAA